jgi:peptide deformylase
MIDTKKIQLTYYPADVLTHPARPVEKIDKDIRSLIEKMTVIMLEKKGVGLAAPQAGVPLRLFIISLNSIREAVKVYINPNITPEGEVALIEEGCLSVPGVYTKIRRYKSAKSQPQPSTAANFPKKPRAFMLGPCSTNTTISKG